MAAGLHVALLRGINVGGRNKLPMKTLVQLFEDAGATEVRTYIQSGNVVYRASAAVSKKLPDAVQQGIARTLTLDVPVVTRTAKRWHEVVGANPYIADGADTAHLHVAFLADKPTARRIAALDPDRSRTDSFRAIDAELFLHCPGGMARTKLTNAYFDRALATVSTMRNWNTVLKLAAMCDEAA